MLKCLQPFTGLDLGLRININFKVLVYFQNRTWYIFCISRKEVVQIRISHTYISDNHVGITKQVIYYKEVLLSRSARHNLTTLNTSICLQKIHFLDLSRAHF